MISDLLDVSRLQAGGVLSIETAPVDRVNMVDHVGDSFRLDMKQNEIRLALDLADRPIIGCADNRRIQQVISNLLQNAMKFTPVADPFK